MSEKFYVGNSQLRKFATSCLFYQITVHITSLFMHCVVKLACWKRFLMFYGKER